MATITLDSIRHTYAAKPRGSDDWALKGLDLTWSDGGAYALLGPSGCGKTTLLNIVSGLVRPTEGRVLFDDADLTDVPTDRRHIAQVFQFPVVYDTMTVYDNLAFPLRNRGVARAEIEHAVREIAHMLGLETVLERRASGLTADAKQKISLGRGLVRSDVNVIMFDEPLTVVDPHVKWQLRSKLKELHQRIARTMIYVTHDQTEALTFADKVVVMHGGQAVQTGSPVELFERPRHTFVGHFIGSPGMNLLPCRVENGAAYIGAERVEIENPSERAFAGQRLEIGIRPEFVTLAETGLPVDIVRVSDAGRTRIVEARLGESRIKLLAGEDVAIPADRAFVRFDPAHTRLYADDRLVE
ncbi:MAG TPA: ABC transporter ATP-binding protein [Hyphomicrobiaceae bacterium]|nr:ABC transporter ATP-binding protein [Hyphomicrobiaceae bacterium]